MRRSFASGSAGLEAGCSRRFLLALSLGLATAGSGLASCARRGRPAAFFEYGPFLTAVAGVLIPETDTWGADAVPISAGYVAMNAISVGMDDATVHMVALLRAELDGAVSGPYAEASDASRLGALEGLDARAYAAPEPRNPTQAAWRKIKGLLLLAYYTSEEGAAKELVYELSPGRYDPDLKLTPQMHAISSDWFAVSFR